MRDTTLLDLAIREIAGVASSIFMVFVSEKAPSHSDSLCSTLVLENPCAPRKVGSVNASSMSLKESFYGISYPVRLWGWTASAYLFTGNLQCSYQGLKLLCRKTLEHLTTDTNYLLGSCNFVAHFEIALH